MIASPFTNATLINVIFWFVPAYLAECRYVPQAEVVRYGLLESNTDSFTVVVLSRYLHLQTKHDPTKWQNKTALELGAGTGIVACALGSLRVPGLKIWSTDLEQLLPLARQNVALNQLEDVVEVEELAWGKPLPENVPQKPDLLLLADCIYVSIGASKCPAES